MKDRLEDQIRGYTEALYAVATPLEELAPAQASPLLGDPSDPVQIRIEPRRRASTRGPLIGLAATLLVLLAAVPILLLSRSDERDAAVANPFVGSWETFDPDSSRVLLQLAADGSLSLRDEAATGCANNGLGLVPATLSGTAVFDLIADPPTFEASGDLYCETETGGARVSDGLVVAAEYDPTGDVLIGTAGQLTCWSRTGSGDRSACPSSD